jgi:glycosidase
MARAHGVRSLAGLVAAIAVGCGGEGEGTCPVEIRFLPGVSEQVSEVFAMGDWNGWDPDRTLLSRQPDGSFAVTLDLAPGDYAYRLVVDDEARLDPEAPLRTFGAGGDRESSLLRVDDCSLPSWEVRHAGASPAGELVVEARFVPGRNGVGLDRATVSASAGVELSVAVSRDDPADVRISAAGLASGRTTVRLRGADRAGREAPELVLPLWVEREAFDWRDAVVYQVVTDRFAPSGEPWDAGLPHEEAILQRHGGDLVGLTEVVRSGYFEDFGVRAIWISPLYDNPDDAWPWYLDRESSAYHGYWPVSSRDVEPLFGGADALRDLVHEAHSRGLRIIADVVPNHVHIEHPLYSEHAGEGWFNGAGECVCGSTCSWETDLERCWFSDYLPDLDWRNPIVAAQVVDDTVFWLDEFELDGLRIDAVPMMPLLATREIVWAVRRRLERGPTRVHLLGETYTGRSGWDTIAEALGPHGLDGQFDFPLLWEMRRVLARGESSMTALDQAVRRSEEAWARAGGGADGEAVMSVFLGSHDVTRFVSEAAGSDLSDGFARPPPAPDGDEPYQRLLLAHALVLTLPGAPVIYYGDEIGLPGASDPDNRRPMRFDADLAPREAWTLEAVGRLGRLRACLPALRRGRRATLVVDDDVYVYLRDAGDGAPAIVVLNRAAESRVAEVVLPAGLVLDESAALQDALGGEDVTLEEGRTVRLPVPALTAAVFIPAASPCAGR